MEILSAILAAALQFLGSDEGVTMLGGGVGLVFLMVLRFVVKARKYEGVFRAGVPVAYAIVNDISKRTPNKVDDKVALVLKALNDWMLAHGQPELKPVDVEKAKLLFSAMHGEESK
jgi:hypothetical protein